jgi:lipocalin-like protein
MNRRSILNMFGIVPALGLAFFTGIAAAQTKTRKTKTPKAKTLKEQLIGTWTFVVTEATQADGKKLLPFGPNPKGVNSFTADGHFVQIQIADGIPPFASNSRITGTVDENRAVVQGTLALFGTYTVDEAARMLIYRVTSSTFPNWVGLEQKRPIDSITADELRHSNLGGSIAGATTVNIWRRAK